MAFRDDAQALTLTLKALYGDLMDQPLFPPASGKNTSRTAEASASLEAFAEEIKFCQRCVMHIGRGKLVFGRGDAASPIAFVGDFPSDSDDKQGKPFSDEAGALLEKMIVAMKLRPESVYLTSLFKCRPPSGQRIDNELHRHCEEHLKQQFRLLQATHIVAMGEHAARALARSESPLHTLRRQTFEWEGRQVFCTHHPRDLLTQPTKKKEAWEDLQSVMRSLGTP